MIIEKKIPDFGFSTELNEAHTVFGQELGIIAYVEGFEDVRFWTKEFKKLKLEINVQAISDSGIATANGKTTILMAVKENRIILGKKNLICIDSDYDYLLDKNTEIYANDFCFQTYTYSIENYYYNPVDLTELCFEAACTYQGKKNHLELLLIEWSKYIYSCFILYLIGNQTEHLNFIELSINKLTLEKTHYEPTTQYSVTVAQAQKFTQKGLTSENVFLYFRGHDLETAIKPLAEAFIEQLSQQKKDKILSLNKDSASNLLKEYFNKRKEITHLAEARHQYPENHCYTLLQSDIQAYKTQYT